jgi:hypothetical protein
VALQPPDAANPPGNQPQSQPLQLWQRPRGMSQCLGPAAAAAVAAPASSASVALAAAAAAASASGTGAAVTSAMTAAAAAASAAASAAAMALAAAASAERYTIVLPNLVLRGSLPYAAQPEFKGEQAGSTVTIIHSYKRRRGRGVKYISAATSENSRRGRGATNREDLAGGHVEARGREARDTNVEKPCLIP